MKGHALPLARVPEQSGKRHDGAILPNGEPFFRLEIAFINNAAMIRIAIRKPIEPKGESANLLEVSNQTKKYGEGAAVNTVVDNVSLSVAEDEFIMIMGASGSGKTSLLHLIAGIDSLGQRRNPLQPDNGPRPHERNSKSNIPPHEHRHCISTAMPDTGPVYENIMLSLILNGNRWERGGMKDTVLNLYGRFGPKEHVKKYTWQLSGGNGGEFRCAAVCMFLGTCAVAGSVSAVSIRRLVSEQVRDLEPGTLCRI